MHNIRLLVTRTSRNVRNFMKSSGKSSLAASATTTSTQNTDVFSAPIPDGSERPANPKLQKIVNDIAHLNLLEVSELSGLLKKTLNLPDAPMMPAFGAFPVGGATNAEDEEDAAPKKVQTSFKVKLMKFDDKQKVALIKEIKSLLEGMNLVQAKKFVESAPAIVKEDIPKDEAEKLKEALQKVGAEIEIE